MPIPIHVPRLGWTMDEGTLSEWLKRDGEFVREGEALFELESDKATQEVESCDSGVLRLVPDAPQPGDSVRVGQLLGYLCAANESLPTGEANDMERASAASHELVGEQTSPQVERGGNRETDDHLSPDATRGISERPAAFSASDAEPQSGVSPRAARLAAELGVNLAAVAGTGRGGRIREHDVRLVAARQSGIQTGSVEFGDAKSEQIRSTPSGPGSTGNPRRRTAATRTTTLRRKIAARVLAASQQTAHVTLTARVDATSLVDFRDQFRSQVEGSADLVPRFGDLFIKLSAAALLRHQPVLQQWTDAGIVIPEGIHIAIAIDTPAGLLAPVLRNVPTLPLAEITRQVGDFARRATQRQLIPEELRDGTFTVTNLGRYRVDTFTPILNAADRHSWRRTNRPRAGRCGRIGFDPQPCFAQPHVRSSRRGRRHGRRLPHDPGQFRRTPRAVAGFRRAMTKA